MVSLLALIGGQNRLFALQGGHKYLVKQDDTGDHDIHVYIDVSAIERCALVEIDSTH